MAGHFTVRGKRYVLATIDSLSFDEARELKRICALNIAPLYRALAETDPEAWLALFTVSIQRVEPEATEAMLAEENVITMIDSVEGEPSELPPGEGARAPGNDSPLEPAAAAENAPTNGGAGAKEEVSSSVLIASPSAGVEATSPSATTTHETDGDPS